MQQAPKTKKITRIRLNFSSPDIRLRSAKEFAVALLENVTVKQLILHDPRRQTCWTLLTHLVEGDSGIISVVLEDLDLPEAWSGAQCVKILGACKWTEFVIENSKKTNNFKREDANPFYDNIVTGLATNKTITHFTLRNIPGASNGDISRLVDGLRKNRSITRLNVSLEDVWDRLKIKSLADYIRSSALLEELTISGADKSVFDIVDFTSPLQESNSLRKLVVSPLEISGPGKKLISKGMLVDGYLAEKLKKIAEINPRITVLGTKDTAIPKEIVITASNQ